MSGVTLHYSEEQIDALARIYSVAVRHEGTSGGNVCAKLLLGLYNGRRFPFDLTDLRVLDPANLDAALTVLRMDAARTYAEVHVILDCLQGVAHDTQNRLEHWAYRMKLKGRGKQEYLRPLQPVTLLVEV